MGHGIKPMRAETLTRFELVLLACGESIANTPKLKKDLETTLHFVKDSNRKASESGHHATIGDNTATGGTADGDQEPEPELYEASQRSGGVKRK